MLWTGVFYTDNNLFKQVPLIQVTSVGQRSLLKKKLQVCESQKSFLFVGDQIVIFHHNLALDTSDKLIDIIWVNWRCTCGCISRPTFKLIASLLDIMWKSKEISQDLIKKNCRTPQVWFILGSNFQTPEGTTFICTNNSTQVSTPWDHAAVIPLLKDTRSVS